MKQFFRHKALTINDSNFLKGIGILMIAFHNFFHHITPFTGENEFDFSILRIGYFWQHLIDNPLNIIDLSFSYLGHYGVQLFILISGYGLMRAYGSKKTGWRSFMAKRLNKLYPTYITALLIFASAAWVYSGSVHPLNSYFLKLTFLTNWIPGKIFSLNGPWWFYGMIVELYLFFPLLASIHKKFPRYGLAAVAVLSWAVMLIWGYYFIAIQQDLHYHFFGNLPVFMLGMYWGSREEIKFHKAWLAGVLLLFLAGNFNKTAFWFSHFSIAVLLFAGSLKLQQKLNSQGVAYRVILFYGEISMYLFAVHGFLRPLFIDPANHIHHPLLRPFTTLAAGLAFVGFSTFVALITRLIVQKYLLALKDFNRYLSHLKSQRSERIFSFLNEFTALFAALLFVTAAMRIWEYILVKPVNFPYGDMLTALSHDLLMAGVMAGAVLFITMVISTLHRRIAIITASAIFIMLMMMQAALVQYFSVTHIPLGQVIFEYSFSSMIEIVRSGNGLSLSTLWPFFVFPVLFILFYRIIKGISISRAKAVLLALVLTGMALTNKKIRPDENRFDTEQQYYLYVNKSYYFLRDVLHHKNQAEEIQLPDIKYINLLRKEYPQKHFLSKKYPFLYFRQTGKAGKPSTLSPFFRKDKSIRPRVVIVMTESLSRPVSGTDAGYASFTPFLDSLAKQSLYWPHCFSTSERTFGVLPGLTGSLPNGDRAFLDYKTKQADNLNIINLLNYNHYQTKFFYGGWVAFNEMESYLKKSEIDEIHNQFFGYRKIPKNDNDFSWGYEDGAVFDGSFRYLPDSIPYLSLYLTLSTHSPFMLNDTALYYAEAKKIIAGQQSHPQQKTARRQYRQLATFLYFDHSLQHFFKEYRKRKDFDSTIFIITGDHRTMLLQPQDPAELFEVPMIIYSPMLKQSRRFGSVVSHFDVVPSLTSLLENNFGLIFPAFAHDIGYQLDTSNTLKNNRFYPIIRNSRKTNQAWYHGYFYANGRLYRADDGFHFEKTKKTVLTDSIRQCLDSYLKCSNYALLNNKLIPSDYYHQVVEYITLDQYRTDFESESKPCYKDRITDKKAHNGSYSLESRNLEFSTLYPDYILERLYKSFRYEMEFSFFMEKSGPKNPLVVITGKDTDGSTFYWQGIDFMQEQQLPSGRWVKVRLSGIIRLKGLYRPGAAMKFYFWSQSKNTFYIDDLKVKLQGIYE